MIQPTQSPPALTRRFRLGQALRAHRWAAAAAGLGLGIGVAVGAPVVAGALHVWDEVVTPGFLNLYLSGIPLCS